MSKTIFSYSSKKIHKDKIINFLKSKKVRKGLIIAGIVTILVVIISFTLQSQEKSFCKTESEKIFKDILSEWQDISKRANSTSRIALAPVIGEMQGMKRKIEKSEVPKCAVFAKFLTVKAMDSKIDIFLEFMANKPDAEYRSSSTQEKVATTEIASILANGKSYYRFNSEAEMKSEATILATDEMIRELKTVK